MDKEPALSEDAEESTTRDDETQGVSGEGEEMEVGYAEAAEAYRETMPSLSSDEEADGETADKEGQNVSQEITLDALQCAIELVSGVARDDAQAPGDAHTPTHATICPESDDAQESSSVAPMPARENYLCVDGKERGHWKTVLSCVVWTSLKLEGTTHSCTATWSWRLRLAATSAQSSLQVGSTLREGRQGAPGAGHSWPPAAPVGRAPSKRRDR